MPRAPQSPTSRVTVHMKVMQLGDSRIETLSRARYVFFYILLLSSAHFRSCSARAQRACAMRDMHRQHAGAGSRGERRGISATL